MPLAEKSLDRGAASRRVDESALGHGRFFAAVGAYRFVYFALRDTSWLSVLLRACMAPRSRFPYLVLG